MDIQNSIDDLLDAFSDPVRKAQRELKKKQHVDEKCQHNMNQGKRFAVNEFNTPPAWDELKLWQVYARQPLPPLAGLQELYDKLSVEMIGYAPDSDLGDGNDGWKAILNLHQCAIHCRTWLHYHCQVVGWNENMTKYEPWTVSHSASELLSATMECARMMVKQMQLLVKCTNGELTPSPFSFVNVSAPIITD
jgi:hypothetical protein